MIELTILGEPASKANSRILATNRKTGAPMFIKSAKARGYLSDLKKQVPIRSELIEEDLAIYIDIFYTSRRPDLDPSLILDGLQGRIYRNDRQVVEMHLHKFIDKTNPRTEVAIFPKWTVDQIMARSRSEYA